MTTSRVEIYRGGQRFGPTASRGDAFGGACRCGLQSGFDLRKWIRGPDPPGCRCLAGATTRPPSSGRGCATLFLMDLRLDHGSWATPWKLICVAMHETQQVEDQQGRALIRCN